MTEKRGRPQWSVMVPTYEAREDFLAETVRSVLGQDWSGHEPQIEVVDDASERFDVLRFVDGLGDSRVSAFRAEERRGLAGNWNLCIERAHGEWVHILHQDDTVEHGFYRALERGIAEVPGLGAAFTQGRVIDEAGRPLRVTSEVPMSEPGVLTEWIEHVFVELAIQTPNIVVRRDVYRELGCFDEALRYTIDWDMWKRIAVRYPIWFDPTPLASYRMHVDAVTRSLQRSGENLREIAESIRTSASLLPEEVRADAVQRSRSHYLRHGVSVAWRSLVDRGEFGTMWSQLRAARSLGSPLEMLGAFGGLALERVRGRTYREVAR